MTFLKFPEPISLATALRDPSLRFVARGDFVKRRKLDSSIREKRILLVAISRRMADVSPEDSSDARFGAGGEALVQQERGRKNARILAEVGG
jgi:hypothetical protein